MQTLSPDLDLDAFYCRIATAPERVLILDYDGTLAPFHERPDQARPYPEVPSLLAEIMDAGGTRVVIVSGRPADELPPLLGLTRLPEIWGGHGWERLMPDGTRRVSEPDEAARCALTRAAGAVGELLRLGARLERKRASVALHWRGLPPETAARVRAAAQAAWQGSAAAALELLPFDQGLELRAAGCTKATAVEALLGETGADSAVAYLGDDITDEDAFDAVKPRGLAVLVRAQPRPTAADLRIEPPPELVDFLARWRVRRP